MLKAAQCLGLIGAILLLGSCHRAAKPPKPYTPVAALQRKVKVGMPVAEVQRLLGPPTTANSPIIFPSHYHGAKYTGWEYVTRDGVLMLDIQQGHVKNAFVVELKPE